MKDLPTFLSEQRNDNKHNAHRKAVENSTTYAVHAVNTSHLTPPDDSEWIDFWSDKTDITFFPDKEYTCDCCGEKVFGSDFVGAHVFRHNHDDEVLYIYPTCRSCNSKFQKDSEDKSSKPLPSDDQEAIFRVRTSWLVKAPDK